MEPRNKPCARKANWVAFGLIALAAISSAQNSQPPDSISTVSFVSNPKSDIGRPDISHLLQTISDATSPSSVPTASENAIIKLPSVSQWHHVFQVSAYL